MIKSKLHRLASRAPVTIASMAVLVVETAPRVHW